MYYHPPVMSFHAQNARGRSEAPYRDDVFEPMRHARAVTVSSERLTEMYRTRDGGR